MTIRSNTQLAVLYEPCVEQSAAIPKSKRVRAAKLYDQAKGGYVAASYGRHGRVVVISGVRYRLAPARLRKTVKAVVPYVKTVLGALTLIGYAALWAYAVVGLI